MRKLLPDAIPEEGVNWDEIQPDIEKIIMVWSTAKVLLKQNSQGSRTGNIQDSFLGSHVIRPTQASSEKCIPQCLTVPPSTGSVPPPSPNVLPSHPSPAFFFNPDLMEVETVVLDWLAKALGLPDVFLSTGHGGGVIQGSASEAIAVVVVAARDRYLSSLAPADADAARGKLLVFGSDQTHSCTQKAAMIAGVKFRAIPAERGSWRMSGKRVTEEVETAKREGFLPFFLTATFGTTATCAIDDLEGIAEVGKDHPEVWLHVDAAVQPPPYTFGGLLIVVRWIRFDMSGISSLDRSC